MGHKCHHDDTHRQGSAPENRKTAEHAATIQDRVRLWAYEMHQTKPGGSDMQDWLQAEHKILHETGSYDKSSAGTENGTGKFTASLD